MKGQQQVVSVVIIIGLVLGATVTVLPWANKMIEKRKDLKNLDDVYNFFIILDETIREISKNGGEESLQLDVPGQLTVSPNDNAITFEFVNKVSNIAQGDFIPLNTPNMNETGTLGVDTPSVIFAKSEKSGNRMKITYKLWYRELLDPLTNKAYMIKLNTIDGSEKSTSTGFIRIQRVGTTTTTQDSKTLTITEINIIV